MYSVLRLVHTHLQRSQLTLQVNSTGFHASKLVNNADEVDRIESFLFYTQQLVLSCLTCFGSLKPPDTLKSTSVY